MRRLIPLALALLAAGCGSAVPSTGSSRPAQTNPTPAITPASSASLATYRALGLSFQAPPGLAVSAPVGTRVPGVGFTPGGRDPSTANEQIVVVDNPRVRGNLDQYVATIHGVDANTAHIAGYRATIAAASVTGARDAATMTEAYAATLPGSSKPVAVAREWIFVQVGPHHVKSLLALCVPARGGAMDPRQVVSSVYLRG